MTLRNNTSRSSVTFGRFGRFYRNSGWVAHLGLLLLAYLLFQSGLRLVLLSLLTYILNSASARPARFEEISEVYSANEIILVGYGALAFLLTWRVFLPILRGLLPPLRWSIALPERKSLRETLPEVTQGAIQGVIVAFGMVAALLLSGSYRYLGMFFQLEGAPLAVLSLCVRAGALLSLAYSEELLFRGSFLSTSDGKVAPWAAVIATSFAYVVTKWAQFEFGLMQSFSLLLLSGALSVRRYRTGSLFGGTAYIAAIWVCLHALLSLPLFGSDFNGPFLVKPVEMDAGHSGLLMRLMTGGAGGPLSSFAFQAILVVDILRHAFQRRR